MIYILFLIHNAYTTVLTKLCNISFWIDKLLQSLQKYFFK